MLHTSALSFFFFNDTATTEIYTLSLHDALPISLGGERRERDESGSQHEHREAHGQLRKEVAIRWRGRLKWGKECRSRCRRSLDRKSTRLNSSHQIISYAVFCLKKKKEHSQQDTQ